MKNPRLTLVCIILEALFGIYEMVSGVCEGRIFRFLAGLSFFAAACFGFQYWLEHKDDEEF